MTAVPGRPGCWGFQSQGAHVHDQVGRLLQRVHLHRLRIVQVLRRGEEPASQWHTLQAPGVT